MKTFAQFRKQIIHVLTGCLVAAAGVAIVSVLVGSFTHTTAKILFSLASIAGHALLSIVLLGSGEQENKKFELTLNVIYSLIPLSVATSLLGIWGAVSGGLVTAFYQTYLIVVLVAVHVNILMLLKGATKNIDRILRANVIVTMVTGLMVMPIVYISHSKDVLGEFYYRLLTSVGIANATLSALAAILFKLHIQQHPEARHKAALFRGKKVSLWVWILVIFVGLQVVPFIIFSIISIFTRN